MLLGSFVQLIIGNVSISSLDIVSLKYAGGREALQKDNI